MGDSHIGYITHFLLFFKWSHGVWNLDTVTMQCTMMFFSLKFWTISFFLSIQNLNFSPFYSHIFSIFSLPKCNKREEDCSSSQVSRILNFGPVVSSVLNVRWKGAKTRHDVAEWSDFCKAFSSMSKLIITLIHADYCQEFFVLIYENPAAPFSHQRMSSAVLWDRIVSTQHLLVYNRTREIMFSECKWTFSVVFFWWEVRAWPTAALDQYLARPMCTIYFISISTHEHEKID